MGPFGIAIALLIGMIIISRGFSYLNSRHSSGNDAKSE